TRARRFLNLYLDSTEHVTEEYARTHKTLQHRPLEENFRKLLVDMEGSFADLHRRLLENQALSLDVERQRLILEQPSVQVGERPFHVDQQLAEVLFQRPMLQA